MDIMAMNESHRVLLMRDVYIIYKIQQQQQQKRLDVSFHRKNRYNHKNHAMSIQEFTGNTGSNMIRIPLWMKAQSKTKARIRS